MANNVSNEPYRLETTPKRRGKQPHMLRASLFLLRYRDEHRINKDMCSNKNIDTLKKDGFGPPPDKFLNEKGKIEFPFAMTSEQFQNKLVEIYPKLRNERYLLMRADKSNKLQALNVACSCYNPKEIYNSNLGQGKLYVRFATEAEVTATNSMTPPAHKRQKLILPKQPVILVSPQSSVETSVSPKQVNVAQVTTTTENHRALGEQTDIASRSNTNIPAVSDDSTAANWIIQSLLADRALGMKVLSGLTLGLGIPADVGSTNPATILNSTNANATPMSLGPPNALQTSFSSIPPSSRLSDNQANLNSTALVHGVSDKVQGSIPSEPNNHETSALTQNSSAGNTDIPPIFPTTSYIPQQTTVIHQGQQPLPDDSSRIAGIDLLLLAHETSQNLSPLEKSIEDKIIERIRVTGHVDVFPEHLKLESFFMWIQAHCEIVRSVTLHPVGELQKFLENVNEEFTRGLKHVTWPYSQQNCSSSDGAKALVKMLPSLRLLEQLRIFDTNLDEVNAGKVLQALKKSCQKLKILSLGGNKVGARLGATVLAEILPSLQMLEELYLHNNNLGEVGGEKVLQALKSCPKLKILYLGGNKVGARCAIVLAEILPSLELLEKLYLVHNNLDEIGGETVLQALKSCKKLKILHLNGNKVGVRGATVLAEMLPSLPCLERLSLLNVSLDDMAKSKLHAAICLSKINVIW